MYSHRPINTVTSAHADATLRQQTGSNYDCHCKYTLTAPLDRSSASIWSHVKVSQAPAASPDLLHSHHGFYSLFLYVEAAAGQEFLLNAYSKVMSVKSCTLQMAGHPHAVDVENDVYIAVAREVTRQQRQAAGALC
jgi:hypothetical protein